MVDDETIEPRPRPDGPRGSAASVWVLTGLVGMIVAGVVAYTLLKPAPGPTPEAIAGDPWLMQGRSLYLERCATCHGETGRGDGPVAKISVPPPGDLTDDDWKHGDQPDEVVGVIEQGIRDTNMPPWRTTFDEDQIRSVAAYVYLLAGREVPDSLRSEAMP